MEITKRLKIWFLLGSEEQSSIKVDIVVINNINAKNVLFVWEKNQIEKNVKLLVKGKWLNLC